MAMSGMESILASARQVTKFVAPGPLVAMQTPTLAGGAGVALGHEAAALLVARQDGADLVLDVLGQRLVQRHAGPAGIGEDGIDAVIDQTLDEDVRARYRPLLNLRHDAALSRKKFGVNANDPS